MFDIEYIFSVNDIETFVQFLVTNKENIPPHVIVHLKALNIPKINAVF